MNIRPRPPKPRMRQLMETDSWRVWTKGTTGEGSTPQKAYEAWKISANHLRRSSIVTTLLL